MMEGKEPHAVSLKVLRLSRPTLAQQQPLPPGNTIDSRAALADPNSRGDEPFMLSPMLTLPIAFGSAYVGETFDCTICVNNELSNSANRKVTSAKISAEMQTPSQMVQLQLSNKHENAAQHGLDSGESVQAIVHFDLREEGSHTLIVSISYNEMLHASEGNAASGGRIRSFRKLYQFNAGPCLSVRTKATELEWGETPKAENERYILEAQLENLADSPISLETVIFEPREAFRSRSLNWDLQHLEQPMMAQREITQVAFLLEATGVEGWASKRELTRDGRTVLGVLTIHWRSEMGQAGVLSTGWLTTRKR